MKGNVEYAFLYVSGKDRPSRATFEGCCEVILLYASIEERVGASYLNDDVADVVASDDGHVGSGSGSSKM